MLPNPPDEWGQDEITKFLDTSRGNEYATFANIRPSVRHYVGIDKGFRKAIESLSNTKDWFAAFFLLRAHSNFLASVRLVMSGQVPETYATLRSCLENGLYGFYLSQNPASRETWLRRHDSDQHKKKVRKEFTVRSLLNFLKAANANEGSTAEVLYERSIDYGAHPNEMALMQTLKMNATPEKVAFKVLYLDGDSTQLRVALKSTAQIGVCVLSIFRLVYKERFDLIGLTTDLDSLKTGL